MISLNSIQYGPFWDCLPMGGGQKGPLPENLSGISYNNETRRSYTLPSENLSGISYNDETWHSYTLPSEDPKII